MCYNPNPPYEILSTSQIDFGLMRRLNRFARYWDLIGNSGRFRESLSVLLGDTPFQRFMKLSDWLYATNRQVHGFALKRLFDLVHEGAITHLGIDPDIATPLLAQDFQRTGIKGLPGFLRACDGGKKGTVNRNSRNERQLRYKH